MKKLVQSAVVGTMLLCGSTAFAGGPVILEEGNNEVIAEAPRSNLLVPLIIGLIVIAAVAGGGSDGGSGGTGGDGDGGGDPDPKS
jgi:hypothetical protein